MKKLQAEIIAKDESKAAFISAAHNVTRFTKSINTSLANLANFTKVAQGVIGVMRSLSNAFTGTISVFQRQAKAEVTLAVGLARLSKGWKSQLEDMKRWAAQLSAQTGIADEYILELAAMGATLGRLSGEDLKAATEASLDLAAATGRDARMAMQLFARAAVGASVSFARVGVKVDETKKGMDLFRDAVSKTRIGLARAIGRAGLMNWDKLKNAIGDVREGLGRILMSTGAFRTLLKSLVDFGNKIANALADPKKVMEIAKWIDDVVKKIINAGKEVVVFILSIVKIIVRAIESIKDAILDIGRWLKEAFSETIDEKIKKKEERINNLKASLEKLNRIYQQWNAIDVRTGKLYREAQGYRGTIQDLLKEMMALDDTINKERISLAKLKEMMRVNTTEGKTFSSQIGDFITRFTNWVKGVVVAIDLNRKFAGINEDLTNILDQYSKKINLSTAATDQYTKSTKEATEEVRKLGDWLVRNQEILLSAKTGKKPDLIRQPFDLSKYVKPEKDAKEYSTAFGSAFQSLFPNMVSGVVSGSDSWKDAFKNLGIAAHQTFWTTFVSESIAPFFEEGGFVNVLGEMLVSPFRQLSSEINTAIMNMLGFQEASKQTGQVISQAFSGIFSIPLNMLGMVFKAIGKVFSFLLSQILGVFGITIAADSAAKAKTVASSIAANKAITASAIGSAVAIGNAWAPAATLAAIATLGGALAAGAAVPGVVAGSTAAIAALVSANAAAQTGVAALQEGGIVVKPTVALIGEGKEPEAVLPLSKLESLVNPRGNINVSVNITAEKLSIDDEDIEDIMTRGAHILGVKLNEELGLRGGLL